MLPCAQYVCTKLVPEGHPLIVTSRPEGVRLRLYKERFIILNLEALTTQQQKLAIKMQLQESPFFNHLSAFSEVCACEANSRNPLAPTP